MQKVNRVQWANAVLLANRVALNSSIRPLLKLQEGKMDLQADLDLVAPLALKDSQDNVVHADPRA